MFPPKKGKCFSFIFFVVVGWCEFYMLLNWFESANALLKTARNSAPATPRSRWGDLYDTARRERKNLHRSWLFLKTMSYDSELKVVLPSLTEVICVDIVVLATVGDGFKVSSPRWNDPKQFIRRFLMVDDQGNVRGFRGMWGWWYIWKRENESNQSVADASKIFKNITQLHENIPTSFTGVFEDVAKTMKKLHRNCRVGEFQPGVKTRHTVEQFRNNCQTVPKVFSANIIHFRKWIG